MSATERINIAARVYIVRVNLNLTQNELAQRLGISGKLVSAWELGNREPSLRKLELLCDVVGISIVNFLTFPLPDGPNYEWDRYAATEDDNEPGVAQIVAGLVGDMMEAARG